MATRYWVGGAGTWDTSSTTHWSATSGGASGASAPTSTDDVIFDNSSASTSSYTVTIASGGVSCNTINNLGTTRFPYITSVLANTISIAGSGATVLYLPSGVLTSTTITYQLTYSGGTGTRTIASYQSVNGQPKITVNSSSDAITITGIGANPCTLASLNFSSGCTNTLTYGSNVGYYAVEASANLLTLQSGMTLNTSTYVTTFSSGSYSANVYTKGKTFGSGGIVVSNNDSTLFIREALTTTGAFTYTTTATNTNPAIGVYADLTCATFSSTGPTGTFAYVTYTFNNNASIVVTSSGTFTWTRSQTGYISGSTSSIKFTSSTGAYTITGGGSGIYADLYVQGGTNTSSVTFGQINSSNNNYGLIINERTVAWTAIFTAGITYYLPKSPRLSGYDSSNRVSIQSTVAGTQFSLAVTSNRTTNPDGYISLDNVNIKDSNVISSSGYLSPGYAGTNSTNNGNNTNWTFGYYVVSPIGVTGTGSIGTVTVTAGSSVTVNVTGIQQSGVIGNVSTTTEQYLNVTGVTGTAVLGTAYIPSVSVDVNGVQATGYIGDVDVPVVVVWVTGVQSVGQIGNVDVPYVANVFGVQGTVYLADVVVGVAAYPAGVQGNMYLGAVAVWITVNDQQTTNWQPINTLQY